MKFLIYNNTKRKFYEQTFRRKIMGNNLEKRKALDAAMTQIAEKDIVDDNDYKQIEQLKNNALRAADAVAKKIAENKTVIAHVGDSRVYAFSNNKIICQVRTSPPP